MKRFFALAAALLAAGSLAAAPALEQLDPNFRSVALPSGEKIDYYDVFAAPFEITGFPWRQPGTKVLYRLSDELAKGLRPAVRHLAHCTSGGTVRFATDSPRIVVRALLKHPMVGGNFSPAGGAGIELAVNCGTPEEYLYPVMIPKRPQLEGKAPVERSFSAPGPKRMRQFTLFLPLYCGIAELEIGLAPGSRVEAPAPQKVRDPVCFYGSSITQGGCASHPANNYTTMLCRAVDAPQINLGFSGNAWGDEELAKAIAGLKLSAFVLDYDHNAKNVKHLAETHEKFFRIIREAQPELPIILVSGPRDPRSANSAARRDVIKATYDKAVAAGDKKVWFVDGLTFFDQVPRKYATVDHVHPNDLGFYEMFRKILPVLKQALDQQ